MTPSAAVQDKCYLFGNVMRGFTHYDLKNLFCPLLFSWANPTAAPLALAGLWAGVSDGLRRFWPFFQWLHRTISASCTEFPPLPDILLIYAKYLEMSFQSSMAGEESGQDSKLFLVQFDEDLRPDFVEALKQLLCLPMLLPLRQCLACLNSIILLSTCLK